MLCSMGTIAALLGTKGPVGAEIGVGGGGTRASEGARALALRDPGNVMEGSSGFQHICQIDGRAEGLKS